jgi:hypothetical protein
MGKVMHFSGKNQSDSQSDQSLHNWDRWKKTISPKFFDRNAIWPKHHLTEHRLTEYHLTESSFDRIAAKPNAVWPKFHFTERSYDHFFFFRKWSFEWINFRQNCAQSFDRKFIWPTIHLTESHFSKKQSVKWTFGQMTIFRKKLSLIWTFGQMTLFRKKLSVICHFCHLTSFSS